MTNHNLTIDEFLTPFVAAHGAGKHIVTALRIERLDALLRECVEAQDGAVQCVECRAMISIEKVFNPDNPVATAMGLEHLVFSLWHFVHSPWLRADVAMQAEQWRFVRAILDAIERTPRFRELHLTPDLERQITVLRDHVTWGLKLTSQARKPR